MSYSDFASVYDILMSDVDYKGRTAYLLKLFKTHGNIPKLLLDLACGTGGFSNCFAQKGIEVIGVDMSEEMLAVAKENSIKKSTDILFLCQKAEELDLYGTVDGAICCMDSLNHITSLRNLKKAIKNVALFLEKDGLFIFDLNSEYKHRHILSNNTFVIEEDDVYCVWQNDFDESKLITDISLDFFVAQDDCYKRSNEEFSERVYKKEQIEEILSSASMELIAEYDDMTENPPNDKSERIIYVAKKL